MAVSALPGKSATPSGRETLEALGLNQDFDGFLNLALVRLELLFEKDGARHRKLLGLEAVLEEVEALAWPAGPARGATWPRPATSGLAAASNVELVQGDLVSKSRTYVDAAIRRSGARRLPYLPPRNPRATDPGWG
jgi:hypothetical protein